MGLLCSTLSMIEPFSSSTPSSPFPTVVRYLPTQATKEKGHERKKSKTLLCMWTNTRRELNKTTIYLFKYFMHWKTIKASVNYHILARFIRGKKPTQISQPQETVVIFSVQNITVQSLRPTIRDRTNSHKPHQTLNMKMLRKCSLPVKKHACHLRRLQLRLERLRP